MRVGWTLPAERTLGSRPMVALSLFGGSAAEIHEAIGSRSVAAQSQGAVTFTASRAIEL